MDQPHHPNEPHHESPSPVIGGSVAVPLLRLGESIVAWQCIKLPEPYTAARDCADPDGFLESIKSDTFRLQNLVAHDSAFEPLRKAFGVTPHHLPDARHIQAIALVAYADIMLTHEEHTPASIAHKLAPLIDSDYIFGKLAGRRIVADLMEKGVITMTDQFIHACDSIHLWISGNHPLCVPRLNSFKVFSHLAKIKSDRDAKAKGQKKSAPPAWLVSPVALYNKLKEVVIGQDEACRVLATRGWLHLKRAELLRKGQNVGSNECLFFISQQSGVGKTWLAENYGKLCCLPFVSFSATDATTLGFVGMDIVEDSIKMLLKASGGSDDKWTIPRARRGIIFYDEFTKKRSSPLPDGRDINGSGVQQEMLRIMEGCKVTLGNRKMEREHAMEFDTTGLFLIFGGYVDGFDKVIARLNRKERGLGFVNEGQERMRDAYLYDALVDYGFIPEFVNRLTKIVMFRRLTVDDLEQIALSPSGVIRQYNNLLGPSDLHLDFTRQGVRLMAALSVETGQMARGLRLIVSSLVEDAVFNGVKRPISIGRKEVKAAIERATSLNTTGSLG
jgi:ATP-dependent protease Clp ATPase subunit